MHGAPEGIPQAGLAESQPPNSMVGRIPLIMLLAREANVIEMGTVTGAPTSDPDTDPDDNDAGSFPHEEN